MSPLLSEYAETLRQVAKAGGDSCIDVFQRYDEYEIATQRSCSDLLLDGLHPNQQGQDLVAAELIVLIPTLLKG